MKGLTRRRFLQFAVTAGAQGQTVARWTLQGIGLAILGACRSFFDGFRKPVRWVFPSTAGDFVIHTTHDARKVRTFPMPIWAARIQFPAVAATMVDGTDSGEIDSDQVEMTGVWVVIDARPGTQLFRESDIVRSDVLRAQPSGDFTLEVTPQPLFPPLSEVVPMTLDVSGAPRPKKRVEREGDRDQLLKFDFCVRPDVCQTGGARSTLPTVKARWPQLDLLVRPAGARVDQWHRIHREPMLRSERADLSDCGAPKRELRWTAVQYALPHALDIDVRTHVNGDESIVHIPQSTVTLRVRPGFIDLVIPSGSILERRRAGSAVASTVLAESHLHSANVYAFAWASDMPAETTTLPVEISSGFCFRASGSEPWPLVDAIKLPRSGSRIELEVASRDVARARTGATLRKKDAEISRSIEHDFRKATLVFRSTTGDLAPKLTIHGAVTESIFDEDGRLSAREAGATSNLLLVADLFARIHAIRELEVRFRTKNDSYVAGESTLVFKTNEAAWAGRNSVPASSGDWVHLKTTKTAPTSDDYRGDLAALGRETTIRWDLERDRFRILDPINSVTTSDAEIVALAPQAFRASVSATLPRVETAITLPPFALREHRDFEFGRWQDGGNPAFKSLTMWEPRTTGIAGVDAHSPSDFFTTFAETEGGASTRAVYAGFGIDGTLVPLHDRDWAPDERCLARKLAPYRAIAADRMRRVDDAVDVLDLDRPALRQSVEDAFNDATRERSIQRVIQNPGTEVALSPIGGTIAFDWRNEVEALGMQELVLHGFLGRYQKNYAIFSDLLLPYGIRYNVLALTSRQDSGSLRYCVKWWFTEPSKTYGDKGNIVISNLRPINSVNFNENDPLLFKADIDYKNGNERWIDYDRTLQGIGLLTAINNPSLASRYLSQTVPLREPQALTLFRDTPMRLHHVEWHATVKSGPGEPIPDCNAKVPQIVVTARGELEDVSGMTLDSRAVAIAYDNTMNPNDGRWCATEADGKPEYAARALTLGDGVVRVDRPLNRDDTFELNANAEHTFRKKITMRDVGLLQLVLGGENDFLDNEGTLTIHEKIHIHDKQVNRGGTSTRDQKTEAEVDATVEFAEFTKGVTDACEGSLSFRIKITPRSFRATFKKSIDAPADYDATLKADVGVPGLLVLKNCTMQSRPGEAVAFKPGDLEPCGDLLKQVFELLLDKLKGLLGFGGDGGGGGKSPFKFEFLDGLKGFMVSLRLPVPRIPFGIGSLENLTFDFRLGLSIDISRSGINTGSMFTFILGDYPKKGFGGIKWLDLPMPEIGMQIFKDLRPPTLTVTPFTVRFSTIIAVRVKPPKTEGLTLPNPFKQVCFEAVACISGEGGLALSFDIGVANGTVSITLGIVWCPHAAFKFEFTPSGARGDEAFSFDEIALVARLELNASVLGVVNIFVRVQAMAQLKLTCKESILTHLEISGTASIEMLFVTVDVSFTVNLDPLLGINPNACPRDKVGPAKLCALPEPNELARVALADFFTHTEVAA